jgi:hypothetical protein
MDIPGWEKKRGCTLIAGFEAGLQCDSLRRPLRVIASQPVRLRRPDDRLREAIQSSLKEDWIALSQVLLALTVMGRCA